MSYTPETRWIGPSPMQPKPLVVKSLHKSKAARLDREAAEKERVATCVRSHGPVDLLSICAHTRLTRFAGDRAVGQLVLSQVISVVPKREGRGLTKFYVGVQ
jgi:hypothetical protein